MKAKAINEATVTSNDTYNKVKELAENIKRRHTLITMVSELIDQEKDTIKGISTNMFFEDLEKEIPEVYTAHDYHTEDGIVRTSFKIKSRPMVEINGQPASKVIREIFQEHTEKLFKVQESFEADVEYDDMLDQYKKSPELFNISLKSDISPEDMMKLAKSHPEFFEARITDIDKYAKAYPDSVKKSEALSVKSGFLEAFDKVEGSIKMKAKKFVIGLLKPSLSTAVTCNGGDVSKKK